MNNKTKLIIPVIISIGLLGYLALPALAHNKTAGANPSNNGARVKQHHNKVARINQRLNKAVQEGKITADQKALIEAKLTELRSYHLTLKDLPKDQRRQALEAKRAELVQWASDNGITIDLFRHKK